MIVCHMIFLQLVSLGDQEALKVIMKERGIYDQLMFFKYFCMLDVCY